MLVVPLFIITEPKPEVELKFLKVLSIIESVCVEFMLRVCPDATVNPINPLPFIESVESPYKVKTLLAVVIFPKAALSVISPV